MTDADRLALIAMLEIQRRALLAQAAAIERVLEYFKAQNLCYNSANKVNTPTK